MSDIDPRYLATEFNASAYLEVAREHYARLTPLYEQGDYALVMYIAGVAVESIFRAYRYRIDPVFDARHDLYQLAKLARFAAVIPYNRVEKYAAALAEVGVRWSNNHRYRSEERVRRFLKRARLDRGIKGDALKENARRIVIAAMEIVNIGVLSWQGS